MDPNYILAWLAGLSALTWGVRAYRSGGARQFEWVLVAGVVLLALGVGVVVAPAYAGYVSGALWAVLLLLPLLGNRWVNQLMARHRFIWAARLALLLAALHPSRDWRRRHRHLRALATAQRGDVERAVQRFRELADDNTVMGRHAHLQTYRLRRDWTGLVRWVEGRDAASRRPAPDHLVFGFYLRAFGELGQLERMLSSYSALPAATRRAWGAHSARLADLFVLAFTGQVAAADRVVDGLAPLLGADASDFWRATARQRAGQHDAAAELLRAQAEHAGDHLLRDFARDRLEHPLAAADLDALPLDARVAVAALVRDVDEDASVGTLAHPATGRRALVTAVVAGLLVAVYLIEVPGGTTDAENLVRLGALVGPPALLQGEYWRVVTAGLLHYGFIHLALNLVGIWIFGRFLEPMIGPWRFLLCYVVSGVGALSLILLWSAIVPGESFFLVGASASLMGVVGASAAVLLKRWRLTRNPRVARQLTLIGAIVALQTVFDLVTPHVSFAAHFGGALIGLGIGTLAGAERRPTPNVVPTSPTRSSI